jgi:putative cardiolipin synthase
LLFVLLHVAVCVQSSFADTLRVLDDDGNALHTRLTMVDKARRRIDCAYFEIRRDEVSYGVLAHLLMAARRGVEVRLVVDAYGNEIDSTVLSELVRSGVKIRRYHPFRMQQPIRYLHRMHDKLLIADQQVMIVGGRNLGEVYFGRSSKTNFVDFDVELTGSAVDDAGCYFEQLWSSDDVVPFCGCCNPDIQHRHCTTTFDSPCGMVCTTPAGWLRRGYCTVRGPRSDARSNPTLQLSPNQIQFRHSNRVVTGSAPDITDAILSLIDSACREIIVTTPYLVLSQRMEQSLCAAAQRGVSIRILGNSLASIDKPVAHAGYVNQKAKLLKMGIQLWEFQGDDMLHAKLMLIDDTAVVGSYDLHPRSEYYDSESAVFISNADVSATICASMGCLFARAVRVSRSPGYRYSRHHSAFPQSMRILKMHLLRLPAALIKKHL